MSKMTRMAEKDAERWAYAEMFFGEGAGTMRKLLNAEVTDKTMKIPGYADAFNEAYSKVDMADTAIEAAKDRKRIDRKKKAERNLRGIISGNAQSLSTGLGTVAAVYIFAKQTGLDEPIKRETTKVYRKAKSRVEIEKAAYRRWRRERRSKRSNVTDIR